MKHAFLIIAHNEFAVLQRLVSALDDSGNDIYIHFDKKVTTLPEIKVSKSSLYVLRKRTDVKWGTVSQIKCEFSLWKDALKNGPYDRYTLISGTHFPLMSGPEMLAYFTENCGRNIFPYMERANEYQIDMKVRRYNIMPCSLIWRCALKVQRILGISTNRDTDFYNAGNWASLTEDAVRFLCKNETRILRKYRWSFCGDEFFAPTEMMASDLSGTVDFSPTLLKFEIGRSNARTYGEEDFDEVMSSGCVFARKFTGKDISIIDRIENSENAC